MLKIACCLLLLLLSLVHGLASTSPSVGKTLVSGKKVVVVGGGPVGLYFAALLSLKDPTVQIEILEKRTGKSVNAFGMGVGHRMQNRLNDIPGLYEQAVEISATVQSLNIPLVDRGDLTRQMSSFVLDKFGTNCRLTYGEECDLVDFEKKSITTSSGRTIKYDLLLAADGVNSEIRQKLVEKEPETFQEQHFLENAHWKALSLPKQPDVEVGSFKPLRHPSIAGGRVLPKAPEGHILLLFWRDEHGFDNPTGIDTTEDLKQMITDAMQDKNTRGINPLRKLLGFEQGDSRKSDRDVVFDEAALEAFMSQRAGRSHHLKINQYHYQDSVALIGDSAHAMNSLLGQGCATGLESTRTLVKCLVGEEETTTTTMEEALSKYTQLATKEAHAMTELSLINYATKGPLTMLKALPLILLNMLRGRGLLKRIVDISVPFSQIAKENKRLLKLCRRRFEKERRPFAN